MIQSDAVPGRALASGRNRRGPSLYAALAVALAVVPAPAAAQGSVGELPDASAIVARYVDAIGGREAVLRAANSRTVGRFEIPAAGIVGQLEILAASGKSLSRITVDGLGTISNGYDGEVGWSLDPMMGARLLEGMELQAMRDQAHPAAAVRDASLFSSMETVERTEMGGVSCYKVKFVWKSGRENYDCFAEDTGHLVATTVRQESPMGAIEVTTLFSDYKRFGEILMPTRAVQQMLGQQQVLIVESVEYDVVDDAAFELPPEIRAILSAGGGSE